MGELRFLGSWEVSYLRVSSVRLLISGRGKGAKSVLITLFSRVARVIGF